MRQMEIYLKSGAVLTVDCTEITSRRSTMTDELVGLEWTTPDNAKRKLHRIQLSEIAAIVQVR